MFEPELFGSKFNVTKKVLATFLVFFGAPIVIRRPGNCALFAPLVTPLKLAFLLKNIFYLRVPPRGYFLPSLTTTCCFSPLSPADD